MTNEISASPEAIRRNRRAAFCVMGGMFPVALRGCLRAVGLSSPEKSAEEETRALEILNSPNFEGFATAYLAGRFAYRVIATRCGIEREGAWGNNSALDSFQAAALARLMIVQDVSLGGFSLQVTPGAEKALKAVETDLAGAIMRSLQEEAGARGEDFEEADFWLDVFRGIADADHRNHVVHGFRAVFLDHETEWRHRLRVAAGNHVLDLAPTTTH